jgi:hypothetical protein
VILLTVDALRADRTSLHGYERPTTPTLERLARDAIVCERSYTMGTFTQTACVQFLTSSRPLSYGGYDHGARGRPPTIFKRFHDAGYHTTCLSTLHWVNRFFGYGEGIDEEYQLFGLNTLPGVALAMIRSSLAGYQSGEILADDMLSMVDPALLKMFDNTLEYCDLHLERRDELRADFRHSGLVNARYNFIKVRKLIDRHRREYLAGKLAYIDKHLWNAATMDAWGGRWLPKEWYYCRQPTKLVGVIPGRQPAARHRSPRFGAATEHPVQELSRRSVVGGQGYFINGKPGYHSAVFHLDPFHGHPFAIRFGPWPKVVRAHTRSSCCS